MHSCLQRCILAFVFNLEVTLTSIHSLHLSLKLVHSRCKTLPVVVSDFLKELKVEASQWEQVDLCEPVFLQCKKSSSSTRGK